MKVIPGEEAITEVQAYVEELMDIHEVPMKIAMKIGIVIDEIYSNILSYSQATETEVTCEISEDCITLSFTDNGIPYNPFEYKEPDITADAEDREIGGLGIFITKKIMDSCSYENTGSRNIVTLVKNLA